MKNNKKNLEEEFIEAVGTWFLSVLYEAFRNPKRK